MFRLPRQPQNPSLRALVLLVLSAPFLPGCAFYGGGVSGYVYEWVDQSKPPLEGNLKPVPDAYVVAIWGGTVPTPIAHATSTCLNVKLGKTDAMGYYEIPGWFRFPRFYPVFMNKTATSEYKPGYEWKEWGGRYPFVPSTQTPDERINFLRRIVSINCDEIGEDERRVLQPLYKAVLEEARSLRGISPNIRYMVDGIAERLLPDQTGQVLK